MGQTRKLVLLGEEGLNGAIAAADRMRKRLEQTTADLNGETVLITASGGLAIHPTDGADWDHLFAVADVRLYAAKNNGRNCIETPPPAFALSAAAPA